MTAELESIVGFLDELLGIPSHPDYSTALNGLQVGGVTEVGRVASAVDASERTIAVAADRDADLLIVHHGTFWDGLRPVTGRRLRRLRGLLNGGVALYSAHLPLDAHPEIGNCILLLREIGLEPHARFGEYEGAPIGWRTDDCDLGVGELERRVASAVNGPTRLIPGGGDRAGNVAVVTGGGGSFMESAAKEGIHTLITGEGSHHTFLDAHELGVNLIYAGHYATEVFGVRALGEVLEKKFGVDHTFIDDPSGL